MADVNVTIGVDASEATAAISTWKGKLDELKAEMAVPRGPGMSQAAWGSVSKMWELPGPVGGIPPKLPPQIKQVTEATDEMGRAAGRAGINFEAMFARMAVRMGVLLLIHEAIKLIIEAFKEAANAETDFVHIQEMTAQSTEQTEKSFDALRQIAHDTGQDLEKTVVPAFIKLTEQGFDPQQAIEFDRVISSALEKTGVNLEDVAAKAEIGAAGFADIAKAAAGLGDVALGKWAQSWMKASEAEKNYERDLERNHELTQRAVQDAERLAGAHEEFADKTGLAGAAFQAFQTAGAKPTAFATIPKALADLPGGTQAFSQLLGEMQKRYGEGMAQIAKEEHLPTALVKAGVAAGISGFDEKSLLAAQKRGVEEQNLARTRKEQDERYERTKAFEDARVNANTLVSQKMHDQVAAAKDLDKVLETTNGRLQQMAGWWHEQQMSTGQVARGLQQLFTGTRPETTGQARGQALAGRTLMDSLWAMTGLPGSPGSLLPAPVGGSGTPQDSGKHIASPIVDKLDQLMNMLRGHG